MCEGHTAEKDLTHENKPRDVHRSTTDNGQEEGIGISL